MAIILEEGEVVAAPPEGKRILRLDDDGTATLVAHDGTESQLGGGLNAAWLSNEYYASPTGDDSHDGRAGKPKLTIYEGIQALRDGGGGTLYIDSNTEIGGPVEGQGIWLRRDFQVGDSSYFDVPGFLPLDVPMYLCGTGKSGNITPFAPAPTAKILGSDRTQFFPAIWVVGSPNASQLTIEGLSAPFTGCKLGMRLWVDYDRELDGSIKQIPVLNATRTGTSTVLTVDIDSVTPIAVTSAARTSNVTTLTMANPGLPFTPWHVGSKIQFTSSDEANFSSGEKLLTAISPFESGNTTWTVSYTESAADKGSTAITGSTIQSHGCFPGELLWLTSSSSDFKEQQYYVSAATFDTITVQDNFGSGDADEDDIGTIAHQERLYGRSTNVQLKSMEMSVESGHQATGATHGFDVGSSLAINLRMTDCAAAGAMIEDGLYNDPRNFEAIYFYGGGDPGSGTGVYLDHCTTQNGGIFLECAGVGAIDARDCLAEQSSFLSDRPGMRVWGNTFTSCYVDRFENSDGAQSAPWVEIVGIPMTGAIVTRSGKVVGSVIGGDNWRFPSVWGSGTGYPTPWQGTDSASGLQVCYFADGQLAAKHYGAQRALGPVQARFKNLVVDSASWFNRGSTITDGHKAPDGSLTATKIVSAGDFISIFPNGLTGDTWEVGGRFIISGWVCAATSDAWQNELFRITKSAVGFSNGFTTVPPTYLTGWQYISNVFLVNSVDDPTPEIEVEISVASGKTMYTWGLNAHYIPLSDSGVLVSSNDAAEYAALIRHQPRYLMPGMTGTMEGIPFIAHGGLGIDTGLTKTAGVGSGQLTLTGTGTVYEPRYDADGTTILGWVALLQATVNP